MLIEHLGWTWEYIDEEMTIPRLEALYRQWDKVPPLSVSVACIAYAMGMERKTPTTISSASSVKAGCEVDNIQGFVGALGLIGNVQKLEKTPEWLKTI